jgi:hypothetical protein
MRDVDLPTILKIADLDFSVFMAENNETGTKRTKNGLMLVRRCTPLRRNTRALELQAPGKLLTTLLTDPSQYGIHPEACRSRALQQLTSFWRAVSF